MKDFAVEIDGLHAELLMLTPGVRVIGDNTVLKRLSSVNGFPGRFQTLVVLGICVENSEEVVV